jgi:hypothetical protein
MALSEEHVSSILREATSSSETSVLTVSIRHHIHEDGILHVGI